MSYTKEELSVIGRRIVISLEENFEVHREEAKEIAEILGVNLEDVRKQFLDDSIEVLLFECNNSNLFRDFERLIVYEVD